MKTAAAGTVIGGSLLFTAGLGIATAQPETAPDGLVNVSIGESGVLENVRAADAAQIAAGVCDVEINEVTSLAETTDAEGTEQSVCTNNLGPVLIQQNVAGQPESTPGQAETLPGEAEGTPGLSGDEVPTTEPVTPAEPSAEQGS